MLDGLRHLEVFPDGAVRVSGVGIAELLVNGRRQPIVVVDRNDPGILLNPLQDLGSGLEIAR